MAAEPPSTEKADTSRAEGAGSGGEAPRLPSRQGPARAPGLLRSSGMVGLFTFVSRILGLVRDMVIARYFGAGPAADAFFVAFKIPNFLRRLFAEGAFNQAFVPVLSEYRTRFSHADVKTLVNAVSGTLGFVLLMVTLLAVAGSPVITAVFAPGFVGDEVRFPLATEMLRITFPYLLLVSLTAFAGSILNSYDRFAIPALTPVILNLSLIGAAVWLAPLMSNPIMGLAWGVLIAGTLQLLFQLPFLLRLGLMPRPRLDYRHEGVSRILRLMAPALFGVSVSQINLLLDTVLASFLQAGSVSWLYYSDRLSELPLGVFAIAIGTVILPHLSRDHASASHEQFARTLDWAVRAVLLIGVPAALALILLAEPLLAALFHYGEVGERDILMSAQSLRAYSLGLLGFMLIKILAPGFFSRQDMRTPVRIAVIAMTANMVFNLILVWPLAHAGLALATALSAWLNAGLLWRTLHRENVFRFQPGWRRFLGQLLAANLAMGAALWWWRSSTEQWLAFGPWDRVAEMAVLVVGGGGLYFLVLGLLGVRIRHFIGRRPGPAS
ncbi:MAG: murein biosynthesis integral membrane protein MurJ [Oleiphilaceae bacterium]|nr:murein biosynthesis integral membrane protein MurJ [Oleiphilaceae bacterium]